MKMLSGAEMVVQSLKDLGVKSIFGYPGGSVLDIYDALFQQPDMEHILVRHEQAAVHAADGFSRATGKVGVALVTSGPGATNTLTGIATAYMDSIPLVVLSGQVPTSLIGMDAFQETDMFGCSRPIVKHSFLVKKAEEIPDAIAKAFYIASTGRPGPVVVDLPKDCQNPLHKFEYNLPTDIKMRSYNPTTKGHGRQIKKALDILLQAKRPVLYAGGGAVIGEASEALTALAERLNLPVTNTLMGLGAFPGTHDQFLGMLGMHGTLQANKAMHHSDCILAVGARFDDRVTNNVAKFCPDATVLHIDIDPASISKTIMAHVPIVGAADTVLKQMLTQLDGSGASLDEASLESWWQTIDGWRKARCLDYVKSDEKIKPQQVIEALYKATDGDAYVTSDVGQHQMFAALYYPFDKPRRWINSGGLGTMGFGFPAAMGVKRAFPDAQVACVTGDGSIQMNIQELSTCLQYDIPVKIVSLNNAQLGMVKQWQDMFYSNRHSHSYMESMPDWVKLVEAYGHVGIKVTKPEELQPAMEKAFAMKDKLVFLDIHVDQAEHVYPMQIKFGAMDEMFLSKTERT
ncbi:MULTISPECIES: acetolactate synthase 3 large subunit [Corallincola]|uniref:Acetolactate synthase n=2 Tax=Corallincola TaxID=1775176 RepID=A0A368NNV5_9GAMM|nr:MULTISPECIES: acetolactate synthase 3 large subunit [Corallincola]RCU51846.1 acetolactate synthase 3 large subunit [Corallincola holothuriorum]TAA47336.1 acetolactate synthase 3 large subunit [Corallincola spongiicola]